VGQGLANLVGGFFQSFPISGSFTRTAVNVEAGARTSVAGIVATLMTVLALLFLTPIFYFLPKAVLAAIVIVAAYRSLTSNAFGRCIAFHLRMVRRHT